MNITPAPVTTDRVPATDEDLLSSSDVVQLAGITFRQLDYWVRRGYVSHEPIETRPFTGSMGFKREWTRAQMEAARLIGRLVAAGLPPDTAAAIARSGDSRCEIAPGIVIEVTG